MVAPAYPRRFVPVALNPADFIQLEPLYRALIDRPINSVGDLEQWLVDVSELASVVDEFGTRRYIDKSCHTDDPAIEKAFMHFVEEIEPRTKPLFFRLQKKFIDSPFRKDLPPQRYPILARRWGADVELFREENVPLETENIKLASDYDKICGAMTVQFRGKEYTLQQIARFIEQPDRATRQEAWELSWNRRLADHEPIESTFDKLISLRDRIARNAGLPDYRAHIWKVYKRFDYTPEDCLRFSDAIERTCMPLLRRLDQQRKQDLKVGSLRPWDLAVDSKGRPALQPFREEQVDLLIDKTQAIFGRMSSELAEDFASLRRNNNLDLQSRKGKQPGGYQSTLEEVRQPFIFMNAAGLQRDVETLLHEGGHAFHALASRNEPLMFLRPAPIEFCEVASMTMELLGAEHFELFYNPADAARAKRSLLEKIIQFFPWMTTIDTFQHWLYTHPTHTREQRQAFWLSLMQRFGHEVDWSGYEPVRDIYWQRQMHLFSVPFYYVEYGIAQLGALQLWMKAKEDPRQALTNYRAALALGGTRSLPDLFAAAGIRFDFSEQTLRPLMNAIQKELESLPT